MGVWEKINGLLTKALMKAGQSAATVRAGVESYQDAETVSDTNAINLSRNLFPRIK